MFHWKATNFGGVFEGSNLETYSESVSSSSSCGSGVQLSQCEAVERKSNEGFSRPGAELQPFWWVMHSLPGSRQVTREDNAQPPYRYCQNVPVAWGFLCSYWCSLLPLNSRCLFWFVLLCYLPSVWKLPVVSKVKMIHLPSMCILVLQGAASSLTLEMVQQDTFKVPSGNFAESRMKPAQELEWLCHSPMGWYPKSFF